jgi:hypothetical protein
MLEHRSFFESLKIDATRGIYSSNIKKEFIPWETVNTIFGYQKPGAFKTNNYVVIGYQDKSGQIFYNKLFSTTNRFKYLHFLTTIVTILKENHEAGGGELWCAQLLDDQGKRIKKADLVQAYLLCRLIAAKLDLKWFDHKYEEEEEIALLYLGKYLKRNGSENRQISEFIQESRFGVHANNDVNLRSSPGYCILDDARSLINSKK